MMASRDSNDLHTRLEVVENQVEDIRKIFCWIVGLAISGVGFGFVQVCVLIWYLSSSQLQLKQLSDIVADHEQQIRTMSKDLAKFQRPAKDASPVTN